MMDVHDLPSTLAMTDQGVNVAFLCYLEYDLYVDVENEYLRYIDENNNIINSHYANKVLTEDLREQIQNKVAQFESDYFVTVYIVPYD